MGQMGFFDVARRYAGLDAKNDPLLQIDALIPWEGIVKPKWLEAGKARP